MLGTGISVGGESHQLANLHAITTEALGNLPESGEVQATARLIPEPDNPYDPQAITVEVHDRLVRRIPRGRTRHVHGLFDLIRQQYQAVPEKARDVVSRHSDVGGARL